MSALGSIDLVLKFRIHALAGGTTFTGESLALTDITFGRVGGIAHISDSINDSDGDGLGSSLVIADNGGGFSQLFDTSDFSAQSGMFVVTNVFIAGMSSTDVVHLNSFSQRFAQIGPAVLPGDYNKNGNVDAADYVVWRKNEGTSNLLPNDLIGGTIGAAQYDQWRSHFGQIAGSGLAASSLATVPEPASTILMILGAAFGIFRRRRVASRVRTTR